MEFATSWLESWSRSHLETTFLSVVTVLAVAALILRERSPKQAAKKIVTAEDLHEGVLPAIRARKSVFARSWVDRAIPADEVQNMLDAAMWAPFHGPRSPWRFVVLGKSAMVDMQRLTLAYYDKNWQDTEWSNGKKTEPEYLEWRKKIEGQITGRWGPISYMIAIVMQRQAGSKRMPEWEEMCATAAAVQNMHIQACSKPGTASYWSSWHSKARDSEEMREFLGMKEEDRCLGFFVVGACDPKLKDNRRRSKYTHMVAEWRD